MIWLDKITITLQIRARLPRWHKMGIRIIPAKHITICEDDKKRTWYSSLIELSIPIHYKYKPLVISKLRKWGWRAH